MKHPDVMASRVFLVKSGAVWGVVGVDSMDIVDEIDSPYLQEWTGDT